MARRNVRKLPLRPPLPRRAVVWFPPFPHEAGIEVFRRQYDPLADPLPAHVHLVFPFATTLTAIQLAAHVRRIVGKWPPLPVTFRDVEGLLDTFALLMVRGRESAITQLHDQLYANGTVLAPFLRKDLPFMPHVTLGRTSTAADFKPMLTAAEARFGRGLEWQLTMRELAVITLDAAGKITIEQRVSLNSH